MIIIDRKDIPSKNMLIQLALMEVQEFAINNGIDFSFKCFDLQNSTNKTMYGCFYPFDKSIHIFTRELKIPAKKPFSKNNSWPGFFIDCTASGIIAHEFGHWLVSDFGLNHRHIVPYVNKYDTFADMGDTIEEKFVEAFRLFLLNPTLLEEGRPTYWKLFTEILSFKTNHKIHWRKIFEKAHPEYITLSEKWIEMGHKNEQKLSS